ncbi:late embryogenesis abundant protein 6-like [Prosopis cineraria]|uniref:late embryogenesis abundant protein 6-like n=1 Tax=Prosopis cineraria TaxID=364024 RepID=UPI00241015A0|nr:late embryogenesis abundant protein 6-like [Prosopis cineraria]
MQAIKEKIQDMKAMKSVKAEARAEEKQEKELAKSHMEIAHEARLAKEAEAEMELHAAKANRKAQKELAKHGAKSPNPTVIDPNHPDYTAH